MTKFTSWFRRLALIIFIGCGLIGPWLTRWNAAEVGIGMCIVSVVAFEAYLELHPRNQTATWGPLRALLLTVPFALLMVIYLLLVTAIGHY